MMTRYRAMLASWLLLMPAAYLRAQSSAPGENPAPASGQETETENWNLYYQATSIGDYHGTFPEKYSGPLSLQDNVERDVSLTTTLFFAARLQHDTFLIFNPEIAGGKGFSGVTGFGNQPNGEIPRVATATPKPYLARLYVQRDFGFGAAREHQESDENQLAGDRPLNRYSIYAGRFTITDFFDNNNYSHDPRTQFMAWGVMYNGAWDYPADTRGYTWGIVQEVNTRNWAVRYGIVAEPTVANGGHFDKRLFRDHGQVWETERRYQLGKKDGAIRVLAFDNRSQAGNYSQSMKLAARTGTTPDVTLTSRPGTLKYGFGISFDQAITADLGVFSRFGWNDGQTESWAFTPIDHQLTAGVSIKATRLHRKYDSAGSSFTVGGLSAAHREYLAAGGLDFSIGDGQLDYAPEYVWESFYSAHLFGGFSAAFDVQRDSNPAYNQGRGPVTIYGVRLHMEVGVKPWIRP